MCVTVEWGEILLNGEDKHVLYGGTIHWSKPIVLRPFTFDRFVDVSCRFMSNLKLWRPSLEVRMVPNPPGGTIGAGQQASQTRRRECTLLCSFSFRLRERDWVKLGERDSCLRASQLSTRNDPIHSLAFAISRPIVFTSSVNFEWRASHLKKGRVRSSATTKESFREWEKQNVSETRRSFKIKEAYCGMNEIVSRRKLNGSNTRVEHKSLNVARSLSLRRKLKQQQRR